MKSRGVALAGLFCALMAISAYIRIPMPVVSSITLQTLVCFLCALLLAPFEAFCSMAVYLLLGLLGLPVFTFGGGLSSLMQPGVGFVLGFLAAAPLTSHLFGLLRQKQRPWLSAAVSCCAGLFAIYAVGAVYGYALLKWILQSPMGAWELIKNFCLLFLPADLIKISLSIPIALKVQKALR